MTSDSPLNDSHIHLTSKEVDSRADSRNLIHEMDSLRVRRAAVVTPSTMGWDNSVTLSASREYPKRFVAIGRVDLDAKDGLTELRTLLDEGFRGIRLTFLGAPRPPVLVGDRAQQMAELLIERNAVAEFHVAPESLSQVADFGSRHPGLSIIVDHLGRPMPGSLGTKNHSAVLDLASLPSVFLKTPGLGFFSQVPFPHEDLEPFLHAALDSFGAGRILWGSDWPGCEEYGPYRNTLEGLLFSLEKRSKSEKNFVLGGTFEKLFPRA